MIMVLPKPVLAVLFVLIASCLYLFLTQDNKYNFMGNSSSSPREKTADNASKHKEMNSIAPLIIQPTIKHTASVIFLHGLGDTGHGWCDAFREIKKPNVKYIFPTAPIRSVTLNGGMQMNAWFDVYGLSPNAQEDEKGINESKQIVINLVENEIKSGISSERIIIGGFSQGGATALYSCLTASYKLGGVLAMSTWLPLNAKFPAKLDTSVADKLKTPILQCHGDYDPIVPLSWAQASVKLTQSLGFENLKFKTYRGLAHSSSEQEMDDVSDFIKEHLKD